MNLYQHGETVFGSCNCLSYIRAYPGPAFARFTRITIFKRGGRCPAVDLAYRRLRRA